MKKQTNKKPTRPIEMIQTEHVREETAAQKTEYENPEP